MCGRPLAVGLLAAAASLLSGTDSAAELAMVIVIAASCYVAAAALARPGTAWVWVVVATGARRRPAGARAADGRVRGYGLVASSRSSSRCWCDGGVTTAHTVVDSPLGPLTLRAEDGVLSGLYMTDHRHGPPSATLGERDDDGLPAVRDQLAAYFAGELRAFDLPVAVRGTAFQERVWAALREIPYGGTTTYRELAAAIGRPTAVRAVGLANGRNPVSIVVPCHRVVGANGSLTGYGGGVERKRALLDLERGG